MEKIDLRKLTNKELYFVKKQIIRLKQKGLTNTETAQNTGVRMVSAITNKGSVRFMIFHETIRLPYNMMPTRSDIPL